MELIVLLFLAFPIIFILYFKSYKTTNPKPPGPPGLPFIGNLHQFDGKSPHKYLYNLSKKYGPIMSLKLGSKSVIIISSANIVKEVAKSQDLACSGRPLLSGFQKLSYNCLDVAFSTYSDEWREKRKICTLQLFCPKQVHHFRPIREDEASWMISKIAKDAYSGKITNLSEIAVSLSSNIICRMALGKSYGDEGEKSTLSEQLHETQAMLGGFFIRDYFPTLGWIDRISGMSSRLEKSFRDSDSFYQKIIDEHLDPNRPKSMEGDIIDILLGMRRDGLFPENLDHIKAILMNILVGGTDTGSTTVMWAMTALMQNPIVMKKVQTEIRELTPRKKVLIDEDDIAKLPYFKATVKETLRLYPAVPLLIAKETIESCTIHGYKIQPGTMLYTNAWAIARDPEFWKEPDQFIPERFLEKDIDVGGRDPTVIPFGIGRRICLAVNAGTAVIEIALVNLLYAFDWDMPAGMTKEDLDYDALPGVTMYKRNALCLVAKPYVPA